MVFWPAVTVVGFLVLTALVIMMGIQSTARYEVEKGRATGANPRHPAPEAPRAALAATATL